MMWLAVNGYYLLYLYDANTFYFVSWSQNKQKRLNIRNEKLAGIRRYFKDMKWLVNPCTGTLQWDCRRCPMITWIIGHQVQHDERNYDVYYALVYINCNNKAQKKTVIYWNYHNLLLFTITYLYTIYNPFYTLYIKSNKNITNFNSNNNS